jgi:hypothetical protein
METNQCRINILRRNIARIQPIHLIENERIQPHFSLIFAAKTPLFATKSARISRKKPGNLPGCFLRRTSLSA